MLILKIILVPIILLFFFGLPFIFLLFEKKERAIAVFLAPIIGLIVFASINLIFLTFLSAKFNPSLFSIIYLSLSIFFYIYNWKNIHTILPNKKDLLFFAIPVLIILCTIFKYPFSFISGGQDEIQYVNNSLFLLDHQNTGDLLDTVVPRIDHWLTDAITTTLTFSNNYRRGSELFLGLVIQLTGENAYVCFTYACIIGYLIYLLSVPIFLKYCYEISYESCLFFQLIMALSWLWIMLTFQGSLANLLSLPLIILPLLAYPQLINFSSYKKTILAGILMSGPFLFYSEVVLILTLIPISLAAILNINKLAFIKAKYVFLSFLTVLCFANISIYTVIANSYLNFINSQNSILFNVQAINLTQFINYWSPIFGIFSYYSAFYYNQIIINLVTNHSQIFLLVTFFVYLFSSLGYIALVKKIKAVTPLFIAFLILIFIVIISLIQNQFFITIRGTQYTYQFTVIGLLFASVFFKNYLAKTFALIFLILLFLINTYSVLGTLYRLETVSHDKDTVLIRYNPYFTNWIGFKNKIDSLGNGPILITGFNSTAKPHFLTSIIEPKSTVLGSDIQKFWKVYEIDTFINKNFHLKDMLNISPKKQASSIKYELENLIHNTNSAIIPEFAQNPIDWIGENKLITWDRWRFKSIGDVLNKNTKSNIEIYIDDKLVGINSSTKIDITKSIIVNNKCSSDNSLTSYELSFNQPIQAKNITIEPFNTKFNILDNTISIDCGYETSPFFKILSINAMVLKNVYVVHHQ